MPLYTIKNKETEEVKTVHMSYDSLNEYIEENPEWHQVPTAPKIVSGVKGVHSQTSDGFRDILKNMKQHSGKGNTINVK
jgi:hypothetical protein